MDHIKDLLAEVNDFYMVLGEHADAEEQIMRELMQPAHVSGLGRPFPGTHPSAEAISRVSRSWSPGCDVSGIPF